MPQDDTKQQNIAQLPIIVEKSQQEGILGVTQEVIVVSEESKSGVENTTQLQPEGKKLGGATGKGFMPGVSGNPAGRPKGAENFKTIFEKALKRLATANNKDPDELYEELVANAIASARKGDYRFYRDLIDRLFGKPKESIDHTTLGEKISNHTIEWVVRDFSKEIDEPNNNTEQNAVSDNT